MFGYYESNSFFTPYLFLIFGSTYYNENADLSGGEDDELLLIDTEVGTDDDQEYQADATTTTAASVEEKDRPGFGPHQKLRPL